MRTKFAMRWLFCVLGLLLFSSAVMAQNRTITGTVVDDKGETVPFASVYVTGNTSIGTQTDMNGRFSLSVPQTAKSVDVTFIGYKKQTVTLGEGSRYDITLESESVALQTVVVVGNMERNKESFTGAFTTVSGGELKQMGSMNVVESLKSLDPSFVVLENLSLGADPNAMPTIEVRGQTSINLQDDLRDQFEYDPNQPLFILDGFESSLQRIVDLDPNRIESVTILKDAASTAFYGSKAANGVVVVTTHQAKAGRFQVFYTGDYSVQIPNLSSYNMMNAREKLEFELLSGRYTYSGTQTGPNIIKFQGILDSVYNLRLGDIERGLSADWMSEPLRVPFIHRQSVRVAGGSDELVLDAGLSYKSQPGIMKGSGRNTWSANVDLNYIFKRLKIINKLNINGYTAPESPYGSFQSWVNTNPYYAKRNKDGYALPYLDYATPYNAVEGTDPIKVINPLYVAGLESKNESRNTQIDERFGGEYKIMDNLTIKANFQLLYATTNVTAYMPPEHPMYDDVADSRRKGNYSEMLNKSLRYDGYLMLSYNEQIGKHKIVANASGGFGSTNGSFTGWSASGFPKGVKPYPSYANNFTENGRPIFSNNVNRSVNSYLSANYAYDEKYLADLSFRYDGTSVFGSAKQFTPSWAAGLGWNLHHESLFKRIRLISLLRLRFTIGQTGNENLASSNSSTIYRYQLGGNEFGQGLYINALGNPNIEWQKTLQPNAAVELNLLDNRLATKFEVYRKITNPLVVNVSQAPSTGATSYPMSLGTMTYQGFEFDLSYQVVRTKNMNWRIRATGAMLEGWYDGFEDKLKSMNDAQRNNNTLNRYRDGYSPKALWAVHSLGIDPATGREIYQTLNGEPTFTYNADDVVASGIDQPKLMGVVTSFWTFKQMTISLAMRYTIKHDRFNDALFNKVENIGMDQVVFNQDKRALEMRWKQPGDISQFKSINLIGANQALIKTDRFIQTENSLIGESVGFTWRCDPSGWIKSLGMSRLDFTGTVTSNGGVFRFSNIEYERGTAYPEATTVSLSISAAF